MQQDASECTAGRTIGMLLAGFFTLLSLYVLSIGPVAKLVIPSPENEWQWIIFSTFYYPLLLVCHFTGLEPALRAYVTLWTG